MTFSSKSARRTSSAPVVTPPAVPAVDSDPIFAAIERQKKAAAAFHNYGKKHGGWASEGGYEVSNADAAAFWAVFDTAPTTPAGVLALLQHLVSPRWPENPETMLRWAFDGWAGEIHALDYEPDESEHISELRWTTMMNAALGMLGRKRSQTGEDRS